MLEKYSIKTTFSQSLLQKTTAGFLLIEIMASLMILTASISLLSSFCLHIISVHYNARMYNNAISLASDIMEKIKTEGSVSGLKKQQNSFFVHAAITTLKPDNIPSKYLQIFTKLKEIELRITWKTLNGREQTYTVSTCCELTT